MNVRGHVRLLSVLLAGLAGAGLLTVGFGLTPLSGSVFGSMLGLGPKGDFSMSSSSNPVVVQQGYTGPVSITIASLNHFSGDIGMTATITTSANAPIVKASESSVKLTPDDTVSFSVSVATTSSTNLGNYNVTVRGKTDALSHSITVSTRIISPPPPPTPDFDLSSNPFALTTTQGGFLSATLTVSSILGYSGNVALAAIIYPSGVNSPSVFLNLTSLQLLPGGTNSTNYFVNAFNATAGNYVIAITGISGSLSHTLQVSLSVNLVNGYEALNLEFYAFSSATNATLDIRNFGSVTSSLVAYYVTDANFDQYSLTTWSGPVISPNQLGIVTVLIGAGCSGCVLSGSAFTFTPGNDYRITLITTYNNQFTFTIGPPNPNQEALSIDAFSFTSSTNVTLYIRNLGTISVQLASYYVRDASGDAYALTSFAGPTIAPNSVVAVAVTIGSSCPGCTLTGNAFTFVNGNSYTIIFVTSRNNQFSFTVTK
ncbi:hypothetical protein E6H34_05635 [Candidatus Bathyarchaeota archaeon]|nr:MAG: hypothetical protein E6H34_05635 [Candidatus Bathyarchaeota archaeon]